MSKENTNKRKMLHYPEGSKLDKFLQNNGKHVHYKILEAMIEQLPKSRAERAVKIFNNAISEITEFYPDSEKKWWLVQSIVYAQILGIELLDNGGGGMSYQDGKKRKVSDAILEELKKI